MLIISFFTHLVFFFYLDQYSVFWFSLAVCLVISSSFFLYVRVSVCCVCAVSLGYILL